MDRTGRPSKLGMSWRLLTRAGAALLVVAAVTLVMLQVDVHAGRAPARSCGSAFDVIAGRSNWETWRAQDLGDPSAERVGTLPRTNRCPDAVNRRTALGGGLTGAAIVLLAIGEIAGARRAQGGYPPRPSRGPSERLRRLGIVVEIAGGVLVVAGTVAVVVVIADPAAPLFLYVDRWVVGLIGVVLLLPVVAAAVGGRALALLARSMRSEDHGDGPA